MMETVIGTIVSGIFGGGVGLLGTLIGRVFGWLEAKEKNKRLEVQNAHELNLQKLQNDAAVQEREQEYAITSLDADTQIRVGSYKHDMALRPYKWVDSVRALTRPILTVVSISLWGGVVYVGVVIFGDIEAYRDALAQANFLATTAYTWWFGSRDNSRSGPTS
jgi:hypothetical protein